MTSFWIFFFIIFLFINFFPVRRNIKHKKNIKTAKKIYKRINEITKTNKGWIFTYLRKIDPFVFEELILYSFRQKGYKIKRNKKYTGDGGIDGKVIINNQTYFIQVKRYTDFINPRHVEDFAALCKKNNVNGYFIHSGKTGQKSYNIKFQFQNIEIISGNKFYELILK